MPIARGRKREALAFYPSAKWNILLSRLIDSFRSAWRIRGARIGEPHLEP